MEKVGFNHIMTFGKYKGRLIAEILDVNPSYIIWLSDNNVLNISDKVLGMAYELQNEADFNDCYADWNDIF
jgi:uncharacterized protein (DUF3820 family)